jgi:hypothetical protein
MMTDPDRAARPDVSTGLWASESGIPADPLTLGLCSGFVGWKGWRSNRYPGMNPKLIPKLIPQKTSPYAQMITVTVTFSDIY